MSAFLRRCGGTVHVPTRVTDVSLRLRRDARRRALAYRGFIWMAAAAATSMPGRRRDGDDDDDQAYVGGVAVNGGLLVFSLSTLLEA